MDIVAYDPTTNHLVHIEPSVDAHSWDKREKRFTKKFEAGKDHIKVDVFPWLQEKDVEIEPIAVLISHPAGRDELASGTIISIDEMIKKIKAEVQAQGLGSKNAYLNSMVF